MEEMLLKMIARMRIKWSEEAAAEMQPINYAIVEPHKTKGRATRKR